MKVTVLVENKAMDPRVKRGHGLSLWIETRGRQILFDFGPRGPLLLENARALGVEPASAELAVLSHGHYDHSGGLEAFLETNPRAKIYAHRRAFLPHLSRGEDGLRDIGADPTLPERFPERFVLTEGVHIIDDDLTLFSDVPEYEPMFSTNAPLMEQEGETPLPDAFAHEQSLLLWEGDRLALFGGCAHRGIGNILRRAAEVAGRTPDAVFAGFHMTSPGRGVDEADSVVDRAGAGLRDRAGVYYTGHCTGDGPYARLQAILGDRLCYMGCGRSFEL